MNALPLRAPRGHPSAIILICVHFENRLFLVMRIPYCVLRRGRRDVYVPRMQTVRKVLVSNGIYNRRSRKNVRFVRFTPPPLSTIRRRTSWLRLRRPSLPAGGQGVQRGLARPDACTTDIIPHTCTGVRPGSQGGASQDGGEFLATSGELHWDAQPATLDNPKSGMHPHRGCIPDFLRG